jgi:hypothetical protein
MDPVLLTIVTGVVFVLATTAVVLALDASARTAPYPDEEIVPHYSKSRRTPLLELPAIEEIMETAPGDKAS